MEELRPRSLASDRRFAAYAWCVLGYNLLVILWGAVVRATGSGAGCGEHWPLCQGVVIPHASQIATLIEFAHRASSGIAVILVVLLLVFAFRQFSSGHVVRRHAAAALIFTLTEGLIGAALVLFGQVGTNASLTRAWILSLHLTNTFLLLAFLALTASSAGMAPPAATRESHHTNDRVTQTLSSVFSVPSVVDASSGIQIKPGLKSLCENSCVQTSRLDPRLRGDDVVEFRDLSQRSHSRESRNPRLFIQTLKLLLLYGVGLLGALAMAVTGTVAALGDTLFHATSLSQGFQLDFSASANPLLRLRIIHPLIAVAAGGYLIFLGMRALGSPVSSNTRRLAQWLVALVTVQFLLGVLNLVLLAPLGMQLAHLLTADLVWITLVLLSAEVLASRQPVLPPEEGERLTSGTQFQSQPEPAALASTLAPTKQA